MESLAVLESSGFLKSYLHSFFASPSRASHRYMGTTRSDRYLYIILEYITGGSIASMISQFGAFSDTLIRYVESPLSSSCDCGSPV